MINLRIAESRLVADCSDVDGSEALSESLQNNQAMPSMVNRQPERLLLFDDMPDDVVNYFFASLSPYQHPVAEACLLRHIASVSKAHQQFAEQRFVRDAASSLAGTYHAIPEIVARSKDKKQVKSLLKDLLRRHQSVYLNLAGSSAIPFMDSIIKMAMQPSSANYFVFDLSAQAPKKEQGHAQNFTEDNKRVEAVIDAAYLLDAPIPTLKIAMILKGRHLFASLIKRLAAGCMPPIHKLDLSGVKLIAPHMSFNPELHGFFLPELLRYLQIFIKGGELTELSLSGLALTPSNVKMLVPLLCQGKALSMLDLSDNAVGANAERFEQKSKAGVDAIDQLLRSTSCPRILKLNNSGIGDADATQLLNALPPQVKQQLHLNGNAIADDHPIRFEVRVKID